jgi:hypothetical protein
VNVAGAGYIFRPNYEHAASVALQDFRSGVLGRINLDVDLLENGPQSCDKFVDNYRTFV